MKNERIITHLQSYTTAKGCVKDLTPNFSGRISVAAVKSAEQPTEIDQNVEMDRAEIIEDLSEIGGIALGTVADLIPGLGPVLSGGPLVGAVVGDVFGNYMVARGHLNRDHDATGEQVPRHGAVYVAVDVENEEEALLAERIMREHDGVPHRSFPTATATVAISSVDTSLEPPGDEFPDGVPQPTGRVHRRIPNDDGYDLDPLPPLSPRGWIDPNIGLGDLELADPTIFAHFDINRNHNENPDT